VDFQQDIRPWLVISHVLVFPSYREGFPNVPMQAGCFHVPAIVTNINGCNEIIEHEHNGLIIPVKNKTALRNAMETLMTNKTLYAHLKANARKWILDRYEQKRFWGLLLHEYHDQLNKHVPVS
jgi:glycosyltransferase involved in cell wall biosynthesis